MSFPFQLTNLRTTAIAVNLKYRETFVNEHAVSKTYKACICVIVRENAHWVELASAMPESEPD